MSHLPLWYIGNISSESCDKVVKELSELKAQEAKLGIDGVESNESTRKTKVHFAEAGYWLEETFKNFATSANQECKWDYDVTGAERIQFATYEKDHHYTWHTDTFILSGNPIDRKITVVCLLNDGFEGGDFELRLYGDYKAPLTKGSIIAFPSILEHRVTPIISGVRHSATMWFNGPRMR